MPFESGLTLFLAIDAGNFYVTHEGPQSLNTDFEDKRGEMSCSSNRNSIRIEVIIREQINKKYVVPFVHTRNGFLSRQGLMRRDRIVGLIMTRPFYFLHI